MHDNVVNQLLTKLDGMHALNNILIVGITNRRDLPTRASASGPTGASG